MSAPRDKEPSKSSGKRAGGIRTLSDLNAAPDPDSDNPLEYYTGGEKSGMLVQDPSKGYDVDGFFDQARRIAAAQGPVPNPHPSSSPTTFTGTGRLLSGESAPVAPEQPVSVVHNIVFWRNGFTVNDGPLRKFDDPENKVFLESLFKSEVPKELEQADRRSPVHVNLIRRVEDCPEPEIRQVSFQGTGRTLGSSSSRTEPTPGSTASTPLQSASTPLTSIVINDSLPSGPIQLRLADGTRMVAHFNHHHTVADIRSFIDAARPGGSRSYQLQTVGFPPKLLHDASQTIEEAGLFNSVVIQKI